jgi:hypothetical protein
MDCPAALIADAASLRPGHVVLAVGNREGDPVASLGKTSARHWPLTDIEQWERERAKLATVEPNPKQ